MARCECGALYVPSGKNIKITFKQGGSSTYMYLEHDTDVLVLNEDKLVSYGNVPVSAAIMPDSISVSFDNTENLKTTGMMKLLIRKDHVKIVEKYFGTRNQEWTLPLVDNLPTITASCSDILNDVDVSDSKIHVEIISVCDLSPGDCCGNTVDITFRNIVHSICTEEAVVVQPTGTIWRYTPNGTNCIQDVNGIYASYPDCYNSIQQDAPFVTSTTCDPSDENCTTEAPQTTTTTPAPTTTCDPSDENCTTTTPAPTTPAPTTPAPTTPAPTTTTTTTTTTDEPPPFVPNEDDIVLSSAPAGNGCYTRAGLENGKYRYERPIGQYVYVVVYAGSVWQHYRIPNSRPTTGSDFIGDNDTDFNSLSPPSTGWEDAAGNNGGINNTTITYQDC